MEVVLCVLVCEYALNVLTEITLLFFSKYNGRCFKMDQSRLFFMRIFKAINYIKKPATAVVLHLVGFIMKYLLDV